MDDPRINLTFNSVTRRPLMVAMRHVWASARVLAHFGCEQARAQALLLDGNAS
jgi:hypothetical protein